MFKLHQKRKRSFTETAKNEDMQKLIPLFILKESYPPWRLFRDNSSVQNTKREQVIVKELILLAD